MTVQKFIPCATRLAALPFVAAFGLSAHAQPDIATLTATEAVQQLCAGTITSEQLVTAYLAQAKAKANLNAFITLDEAGALKAARAADALRKRGGACKPLAGLPVAIKDNIQVQGLPATAGTPALKSFVPLADAPVVARLRAAGAVVLGKTNMHELDFGVTGYNPAFQTGPEVGVRNAYDPTRIAGGSSSGNGAALGARMAPAALGTDTGGSVRIP
ncbi:amidase family protein, partial [Variovorax sp. RHLX14]|uniref:amidase family protein n=1 Tax=Variovorax sp. RHLX14 TaxID=1259731 RepID=UPI003F45BEBC